MKSFITTVILSLCLIGTALAQTNKNQTVAAPEVEKTFPAKDNWELTLGGSGVLNPKTGENQFGFDFSLSTHPFQKGVLSSIWVGLEQGISWEPSFAGSTDLFAAPSFNVYKDLWLNVGWSAGAVYDSESSAIWRAGPLVALEYYYGSNTFLFGGCNYDFVSRGDSGLRYSLGIGFCF